LRARRAPKGAVAFFGKRMANDQAKSKHQGPMIQMSRIQMWIGVACMVTAGLVAAGCGQHSAASPVEEVQSRDASADVPEREDSAKAADSKGDAAAAPKGESAPAEKRAVGQRPPADRTPSRPGEAEKITFDDLNLGMQADVVFRPYMIPEGSRVKELEGKAVSLSGYMHGAQLSQRGIAKFVLLKNTECKFGPGGQADHLAQVILREGTTTEFTKAPVKVEGILKVVPYEGADGNTWAIYNLEEARIR
jgi:hypothetical protein